MEFLPEDTALPALDDAEQDILSAERARILRECMERVEPEAREALWLVYVENLSYEQAAAVVLLALLTPSVQTAALPAEASFRASVFADAGALGCVVVGVTAFLLGAAVAVLCCRLRKDRDDGDDEP